MSAEQAWEAWEDRATWPHNKTDTRAAFFGGYAVASADTESLVRAAVEATREEAAKAVGTLWMRSQHGKEAQTASMKCVRALDIDAIVARVMQSQ